MYSRGIRPVKLGNLEKMDGNRLPDHSPRRYSLTKLRITEWPSRMPISSMQAKFRDLVAVGTATTTSFEVDIQSMSVEIWEECMG